MATLSSQFRLNKNLAPNRPRQKLVIAPKEMLPSNAKWKVRSRSWVDTALNSKQVIAKVWAVSYTDLTLPWIYFV